MWGSPLVYYTRGGYYFVLYLQTCRARIITDDSGFYTYATTMPGRYRSPALGPGWRAVHVHVKVTPLDNNNKPIGRTLTLQQYFQTG